MDQQKEILVIDDEPKNIFALKLTLRARGYGCLTANSAKEGIEIVLNNPSAIGLILMDMMMPEMDGYEAIAVLKKDDRSAGIPVVAVTAQAMAGDKEKCMASGATDYLAKPIDVDKLLVVIQEQLNNFH